ncbi:MAG: hypothetical protein H7Z43_13410 [Clostridia bacterium]|nr:hypothetical protein [Deltaproteobacteria bacterium]
MEELLTKLPPGSERHSCLSAAKEFKASWVLLGERLTKVRESGQFASWGYKTFETYVRSELRLKPDTALKLTRSFAFLRDHEPNALQAPITREIPSMDVVDLLSQARDKVKIDDTQLAKIRREAFDTEDGPMSKSEVMKRFREVDPEAFKPAPKTTGVVADGNVRKALLLAERLETLLAGIQGLSEGAQAGANTVTSELRIIFMASHGQAVTAAA